MTALFLNDDGVSAADNVRRRGASPSESNNVRSNYRNLVHSKGKIPPTKIPTFNPTPSPVPTPSAFFEPPLEPSQSTNLNSPFPTKIVAQQSPPPQSAPVDVALPTNDEVLSEPVEGETSEDTPEPTENTLSVNPTEPTENVSTDAPIQPTETTAPAGAVESTNDEQTQVDNIFKPNQPNSEETNSESPVHDSCEAAQKGDVFETEVSQIVEINYELLTLAGSPLSKLTNTLDSMFQTHVASTLVNCSQGAASDIQGADTASQSSVMDMNCRQITGYDRDKNFCFVMKGALTVFKSNTTNMTNTEVRNMVWSTLRKAINEPNATRRHLQDSASIFVNEELGIVDLFFLNQEGSSVSQVARGATTQNSGSGMSKGVSASLMAIVFVMVGAIGLVYTRRHRDRDAQSFMQKMTDVGDSNSYQQDSNLEGSPRDPKSPDPNLRQYFGDGIDPITPPTPSQLSCPTSSSGSDDLPSVSLFEAYEATPAEDGNIISYSYGDTKRQSSRHVALETAPPLSQMRSTSILNNSDELLEEPPPFMSKIPRSARSNPARISKYIHSDRAISGSNMHAKRATSRTTPSRPDPPRIEKAPKEYYHPTNDYKGHQLANNEQPVEDSFSVTAFLNGHCAAMENLNVSVRPDADSKGQVSNNPSPTSVCSLWSDPKTPPSSMMKKPYTSSVNLWTSQCDSNIHSDDDVDEAEPWTASALKYINSFSPYGHAAEPSISQILSKSPCAPDMREVSPDRGRSPTPIDDSTNSIRRKSCSKTPSRASNHPPGRRMKTYSEPQQGAFKIQSSSSNLRPSSGRSPSPRYVSVSAARGAGNFPAFTADTVEL